MSESQRLNPLSRYVERTSLIPPVAWRYGRDEYVEDFAYYDQLEYASDAGYVDELLHRCEHGLVLSGESITSCRPVELDDALLVLERRLDSVGQIPARHWTWAQWRLRQDDDFPRPARWRTAWDEVPQ